jgi:4-hydroxybenzoate polyprenyltransferase
MEWIRLSRWRGWAGSKLPFLSAAALLLVPSLSPAVLLAIMGTVAASAAFGYAANEVADRASDVRAGRTNHAATLSPTSWGLFLALTAGGGVALSLIWAPDAAAPLLVACALALGGAYSFRPLRLKERGLVGPLSAAAAQWGLPVLAIAAAEPRGWTRPAAWSLCLLGLALGARWIAVHQLGDISADRRAGVRTYASRGGDLSRVLAGALACEFALLGVVLTLTWPGSLPGVIALAVWVAWGSLAHSRREPVQARLAGYDDPPLAGYYFFLLPVALAVGGGPPSPARLAVAALLIVLAAPHVDRVVFAGRFARVWRQEAAA